MDLRTRKGREEEVLAKVKENRGFSIFWATENAARTAAIERLQGRGKIKPVLGGEYPWCGYRVVTEDKHA